MSTKITKIILKIGINWIKKIENTHSEALKKNWSAPPYWLLWNLQCKHWFPQFWRLSIKLSVPPEKSSDLSPRAQEKTDAVAGRQRGGSEAPHSMWRVGFCWGSRTKGLPRTGCQGQPRECIKQQRSVLERQAYRDNMMQLRLVGSQDRTPRVKNTTNIPRQLHPTAHPGATQPAELEELEGS